MRHHHVEDSERRRALKLAFGTGGLNNESL